VVQNVGLISGNYTFRDASGNTFALTVEIDPALGTVFQNLPAVFLGEPVSGNGTTMLTIGIFDTEPPQILSADVGNDLQSLMVQFNDDDLDAVQATNGDNYHVIAANGDANGDGDFFNDGDELELAINAIVYDPVTDQVTLQMAEALVDEVFRLEIDGDDASGDGTPGLTDLAGNFLAGGDFSIDLDLTCLGLLDELIGKVEALGLDMGVENSLVGKLDAALQLLGVDPATNTGILAKMDAFIAGVSHWFDRDEITLEDHDELIDDANRILLCIMLSEEEAVV